jgi:hypothetical protein
MRKNMSSPKRSPKRNMSPKRQKNLHVSKFLSELLSSREQAHILHLQTHSYAEHKALQKYYEGIVDLIDKYAETYQGKYEIIMGYKPVSKFLEGDKLAVGYFKNLENSISKMRTHLPKDLDLENTYADILDLIHSTGYLLNELH